MTDEERMIRDMNGNPPVCAWVVKAGATLDYPSPPSHPAWMEISAKYGKRVFDALMAGSDVPPSDGEMYAQWKQVFRARLSQRIQGITLAEALQQTLNNQRDLTEKSYLVKDVLIKGNAAEIMYHVLGIDPDSAMGKRIQSCTAERLIHALATYLFGCYCRDSFNLSFDALPRIFSSKTTGNAFLFYWSMICLCHDLGYDYENNRRAECEKMREEAQRKALLQLEQYDLLSLYDDQIDGMELTDDEKTWVKKSLDILKKYSIYRIEHFQVIDHGIAGALILYDYLMKIADTTKPKPHPKHREPNNGNSQIVEEGAVPANAHHHRFRACSLLISLAIGRHNIWTEKSNGKNVKTYREYNMNELIISDPNQLISISQPLDQMLYFMEFMDTIDPVKGLWLRVTEADPSKVIHPIWEEAIDQWKGYVFQCLRLRCCYREKQAHSISFFIQDLPKKTGIKDKPAIVMQEIYTSSCCGMSDWMQIQQGIFDSNGALHIFFPYMSSFHAFHNSYGISPNELYTICFYEGSGDSVRPSRFYQIPNVYQTFNLLMMEDLSGEKSRIGEEHQQPHGLYIRHWERMLEENLSIFRAQCRYLQVAVEKGEDPKALAEKVKNMIQDELDRIRA